jgi:hypothetical protein
MSETLALSRIPLDDYAELLGEGEIEELRALAKPLRSRSMEMINSTAIGGGVAEILNRLVPLAEELDLNIKWNVMGGGEDFFEVTKAFHNALHGAPYHASSKDFEIFLAYNERNRASISLIQIGLSGIFLKNSFRGTTGRCFPLRNSRGNLRSRSTFSIRPSIRSRKKTVNLSQSSLHKFWLAITSMLNGRSSRRFQGLTA